MRSHLGRSGRAAVRQKQPLYDGSVFKVMLLAAVLLVFSTTLIGVLSYRITQSEVIKNLKEKQLNAIARSVASQVEGRIARAVESSRLLADDPAVVEWVRGGEQDERLGRIVLSKLVDLPVKLDYTNSFVVSNVTGQYWAESGTKLAPVTRDDPNDDWFFDLIDGGIKERVMFDWNESRKDTFVFVDILIGEPDEPLGVAGVGLSLQTLSAEFAAYKYGQDSHLWMVGPDGTIHLSDTFEQTGRNLADYLPAEAREKLARAEEGRELVIESKDARGRMTDMISYPIGVMDVRLVVQIPRSETTGFLNSVQFNTALAVVLTLAVIVFFFYYVSRKLADPYKQALRLNEELEQVVSERTEELTRTNRELMDSIAYANRIQQSVLPPPDGLSRAFAEHFVIWKPRDVVGGDFYWMTEVGGTRWVAVGDCTGHGVPGALMTMLTVSLLGRIADEGASASPAAVLAKLNALLKATLNQTDPDGPTDDGLELALFFVEGSRMTFASAGLKLFVRDEAGFRMIKGDKPRIGYRRTPADYAYADQAIEAGPDAVYYVATDGILDQNGGPKNVSLGRTRFMSWLESYGNLPLAEQKRRFEQDLAAYMGDEPQRDDMTLLAFRLADETGG